MISQDHKAVFVHIPKCGGQSIETAFLNDLGLDWDNRKSLLLRHNRDPKKGPPALAHLTAREYLSLGYIDESRFWSFYRFAVIRHPLGRAVSMYNWRHRKSELSWFVHEFLPDQFERAGDRAHYTHDHDQRYFHVRPQVEFLYDLKGKLMVDDLFRLEDLQAGFSVIQQKANLKSDLPHVNKSKKSAAGATLADLTAADITRLTELYTKDFELLDYSPNL